MKVLISRTDAIGDCLLTMPMAQLIKENFPDAHVTFLVSPLTQDLFIDQPYIDEVLVYPKKSTIFTRFIFLWRHLNRKKITHYFFVGGDKFPSFMAYLKGISFRGGLVAKFSQMLWLNRGVRQKRSLVEMHESDYNLHLLKPMGIEYNYRLRDHLVPQIKLNQNEVEEAWVDLAKLMDSEQKDLMEECIIFHPGMTGHTLNWPSRNYIRLITRIEKDFPKRFSFLISFTKVDESYLNGAREEIEQSHYNFVRNRVYFFDGAVKGLRHYMKILSKASLFIGPSTGTTHMAHALGRKIVTIYSPIKVQSSQRWGPYLQNSSSVTVMTPEVVCGEQFQCILEKCPYYECMGKIEVDTIYDQVLRHLENEHEAHSS